MRTRIFVTALLVLSSLLIGSMPAICEGAPAAPADVTKPAAPVVAQPAAATDPAKPAETAPAQPAADATKPAQPAAASTEPAKPAEPANAAPVAPATPITGVKITKSETPAVTADTDIFKRTPKIDGVVDEGEWDTFYTYTNGDLNVTTYANWDSDSIYIASKSNKPVDLLAFLDANADGWYNGDDNYEFRVIRGEGNSTKLSVNRYDSHHARTPAASAVSVDEAAIVEMKSGVDASGAQSIEMRIPISLIPKFKIGDNHKIGLLISARTGSDEASWLGSGAPGDTKESTLVSKKIASLKPLELGFDLRDNRIARGEELVAKFHLTNSGADTVDVRDFVIAGEGKAGDFLSSQKVRMEGLAPKRHISHDIRSVIPTDMPLGSWAIGAEVKSATGKLGGALISFDVVEPFEAELRLPEKPIRPDVKDVTIGVAIRNNTRGRLRGDAKITMPDGWELWKNENKREFSAAAESITSVTFKCKQPLGALNEIPVKVDVTINGKTVTATGKFVMLAQ